MLYKLVPFIMEVIAVIKSTSPNAACYATKLHKKLLDLQLYI